MNSLNHYSYGAVMEFVYRYAAGIIPLEPGFRKTRIAPHPDIRMKTLRCSFDSACGRYVSNWSIQSDGSLSFHIEVPFGCEADVVLPEQPTQALVAGCYDFIIYTGHDYRQPYSADTPLERLLQDKQAVAVLQQCLPELLHTDSNDPEAMSKSLNDQRAKALLFHQSTESLDRAIKKISEISYECLLSGAL